MSPIFRGPSVKNAWHRRHMITRQFAASVELESASSIHYPAVSARTWTLPNGLGIIVQEDHSAPVASVQAWIETGSIHEAGYLGAGLSHPLAPLLFNSTSTLGSRALPPSIH